MLEWYKAGLMIHAVPTAWHTD